MKNIKKLVFLIIASLFVVGACGQETYEDAKKDLEKLSQKFDSINGVLDKEKLALEDVKNKIDGLTSNQESINELKTQIGKISKTGANLDSICKLAENYKGYYIDKYEGDDKENFKEKLDSIFNHNFELQEIKETSQPQKTYRYFGKDKVIAESNGIFKDKTMNNILNEVLSTDSRTYLGDFIIPQKGQAIALYKFLKNCKKVKNNDQKGEKYEYCTNNHKRTNKKVYFKEVAIHLYEGGLQDVKIIVNDEKGNELLFENKIPISLLRYTSIASKNYMFFKTASSNNKNTVLENYKDKNLSILLSDVLSYIPNPGENFVPDDITFNFPTKTNGIPDNTNSAIKYKVTQNTALQNVIELRTYTDFLGLFSEAPNGIVQLEGKADFYIAPFNLPNKNLYLAKKISPFVNFSRIEKENRNVALNTDNDRIKSSLEVLEKSYLQMGIKLNVVSGKFKKEFPFETSLYGIARYSIADIKETDSTSINYKSLGLGGGVQLEFKRFNNFGFIISSEFTKNNFDEFNEINGIENPSSFWMFKNEAEVYYTPNNSKNQSVFLRLKTFNNSTENNKEAFYQLQFGYRFSIGVNKLKQK